MHGKLIYFVILLYLLPISLRSQTLGQVAYAANPFKYDIYSKSYSIQMQNENNIPSETFYNKSQRNTGIGVLLSIGTPCVLTGLGLMTLKNSPLLITTGVLWLITPSAGHFYAGNINRPILFTSMRAGMVGLGLFLSWALYESTKNDGMFSGIAGGIAGLTIGAIGLITVTIFDITSVSKSVKEYNERISFQPKIDLGPGICRVGLSCRF